MHHDRVEAAYVVWLLCHQVQNMSVMDPQVDYDKMVVHSLCPVKSTEYLTINQTKDVMVFTWIILPLFGPLIRHNGGSSWVYLT